MFFLSNNSESMKICIDYIQRYLKNIIISLIIFDKESSNIYKKLKEYKIPKMVFSNWKNRNITCDKICDLCKEYKIDFIFLGFNKLLYGKILNVYKNKIINTHPALLPSFKGVNAIEKAFDSDVRYIGMTTHFIDEYG
jgi:phosphoribosylglycinamide formyltransferase 1